MEESNDQVVVQTGKVSFINLVNKQNTQIAAVPVPITINKLESESRS